MFTKYKMRLARKKARRDEIIREAKILTHKGKCCRNYIEQDLKEIAKLRHQLYSRYNDNKINIVKAEYNDLFGYLTVIVYFLDNGMMKSLKDSEDRMLGKKDKIKGSSYTGKGYDNAVMIDIYPRDLSNSGGLDNLLKTKLDTYSKIEKEKNIKMDEVRYNSRKELDKYL